jgi:alpha-amylase
VEPCDAAADHRRPAEDDVKTCTDYINKFAFEQQFSLFDCPLHYNFAEAGNAGKDYDLRKIWDGTLVQAQPIDAVTLVENHDTQAGQVRVQLLRSSSSS